LTQYNTVDGTLLTKTVGDGIPERDSHTVIRASPRKALNIINKYRDSI